MTALAVADKPLIRELLQSGQLEVDYLETTGPLVESAVKIFPAPMLVHNSLWDWSLAHPHALEKQNALEVTLNTIHLTATPWLSIHLGFSAELVNFNNGMQVRSRVLPHAEVFENVCYTITQLAEIIPVPLIIENLDYNPGGAYEFICEPTFIANVLEKTGTGLLLDIAHARVSAARLGYSFSEYLSSLPLQQVKEIHISGPRWQEGQLVDVHETLLEEDYKILENILNQTIPSLLTLEYARDKQALLDQITVLRKLLNCQ